MDTHTQTQTRSGSPHISAKGFTLVELLVTITIVAVLAAIVSLTMSRFIERSRTASCMANMRQIGILMNGYATENNGYFPVGGNPDGYIRRLCSDSFAGTYPDTGGMKDAPFFDPGGAGHCFICPSHKKGREEYGKSYLGNSYMLGVKVNGEWLNSSYQAKPLASILDTSRAFLVIEDWRRDSTKLWRGNDVRYKPTADADNFAAHGDSRHYLYVDGHVELITKDPALGNDDAFKIQYRGESPD